MSRKARNLQPLASGTVTVEAHRREVVERPSSIGRGNYRTVSWVPDGTKSAEVELRVDVAGLLLMLGRRAVNLKNGVTRLAGGLIEVRRTSAVVHDRNGTMNGASA